MSNRERFQDEIRELYRDGHKIAKIAKHLISKYNLDESFDTIRGTVRYCVGKHQNSPENRKPESKHNALIAECEAVGIPVDDVRMYWHKSEAFSIKVNNPINSNDGIVDAFDAILERYSDLGVKKFEATTISDEPKAIKITITDDHVGMSTNPDNRGLFSYEYNGDVYKKSIEKVYQSILKEHKTHGTFELLLLDNLGDREDGWLGQTTRGGHDLPQNMTNAEVFDTIVDTKIALIESLVESKVANKIILRSCANSNHSIDFAIIVNKAIQKVVNRLYSKDLVEVETLEKFIEHRYWGNHAFLLSHGKDSKHMFKGLPLILNDKAIKFINDYINFYKVDAKYIHFEKGDLHQIGFQAVTNFSYRNFTSFAPASAWQQHNFGTSVSGYAIQVVPKWSNEISHTDYFLDYEKTA